jgi:hypothetical protein
VDGGKNSKRVRLSLPADVALKMLRHAWAFVRDHELNLLFHILPVTTDAVWQRHVQHLLRRIELFNGKRVIAIATAGRSSPFELDPPDIVRQAFSGHRIDQWVIMENVRELREVVTFLPLLERIYSRDPHEVTFYGHSKGVTHEMNEGTTVHRWADTMYEVCLDDWSRIQAALEVFPMAGPFKRYGQFRTPNNHQWHFSGTFYWFRNDAVFSRDWCHVDRRFFGTESWPATIFPAHETACLLLDDCGDLYNLQYWKSHVETELRKWRAARSHT